MLTISCFFILCRVYKTKEESYGGRKWETKVRYLGHVNERGVCFIVPNHGSHICDILFFIFTAKTKIRNRFYFQKLFKNKSDLKKNIIFICLDILYVWIFQTRKK